MNKDSTVPHKGSRSGSFGLVGRLPWSGLLPPFSILLPILGFSLFGSYSLIRFLGYSLSIPQILFFLVLFTLVLPMGLRYPRGFTLIFLGLVLVGGLVLSIGALTSESFSESLQAIIDREIVSIQADSLTIPMALSGLFVMVSYGVVLIPIPGIELIPALGALGLMLLGLQSEGTYTTPFGVSLRLLENQHIFRLFLGYMFFWYLLAGNRRLLRMTRKVQTLQGTFLWQTAFLGVILAILLPTNLPPVRLPTFNRPWTSPGVVEITDQESRSLGRRGFSYDRQFIYYFAGEAQGNRLGGDLVQDSTVLAQVQGLSNFYLRAIAHDTYTGFSWATNQEPKTMFQFPEPREALTPFLAQGSFILIPQAIETRSVFTLGYPEEIRGLPFPLLIDGTDSFSQPLLIPSGLAYQVTTRLIVDRNRLSSLIHSSVIESSEEASDPRASTSSVTPTEDSLHLPDGLPSRVRQLSTEVTQGLEKPYQQMVALVDYLRENFEYSEEFPRLSADQDFVDYFLFEHQAGYCTAFASALAVMGRTLGIPTRYVVGFRVPPGRTNASSVQVTGFDAHTWVEAYIDPFGWIPFEPTPGFELPHYSLDDPRLVPLSFSPDSPQDDTLDQFDHIESMDSGGSNLSQRFLRIVFGYSPTPAQLVLWGVYLVLGIGFFYGFYIGIRKLILFLRIVRSERQIQEKLNSGSLRNLEAHNITLSRQDVEILASQAFSSSLLYLSALGWGLIPGETLQAYGKRVHRDLGFTQDFDLLGLTRGLDTLMYSKNEIDLEALQHQVYLFFLFAKRKYSQDRSLKKKIYDMFIPGFLARELQERLGL